MDTLVAIDAVYPSHRSLSASDRISIDTLQASIARNDSTLGGYQRDDLRR